MGTAQILEARNSLRDFTDGRHPCPNYERTSRSLLTCSLPVHSASHSQPQRWGLYLERRNTGTDSFSVLSWCSPCLTGLGHLDTQHDPSGLKALLPPGTCDTWS